jgi:hypothetical protein
MGDKKQSNPILTGYALWIFIVFFETRYNTVLYMCYDEASNIGSQLIAMTLLEQENRVHRAAKKAVAHRLARKWGQ